MPLQNRVFSPREFRVAIAGRLADAHIVARDCPLPPARKSQSESALPHAKPAEREPDSASFSVSEIGRQLAADRQLIEATLDNLRGALAEVQQQHSERVQQWQQAAVEMSMAIASKLLHRQIVDGEFPVENMIRDMSKQLYDDPVVRVRLNPKDLELLEQRLDGQPLMSLGNDPQLVGDPSLGRAECRVDGQSTMMLADLASQLRQIREDLLRSLHDDRS